MEITCRRSLLIAARVDATCCLEAKMSMQVVGKRLLFVFCSLQRRWCSGCRNIYFPFTNCSGSAAFCVRHEVERVYNTVMFCFLSALEVHVCCRRNGQCLQAYTHLECTSTHPPRYPARRSATTCLESYSARCTTMCVGPSWKMCSHCHLSLSLLL